MAPSERKVRRAATPSPTHPCWRTNGPLGRARQPTLVMRARPQRADACTTGEGQPLDLPWELGSCRCRLEVHPTSVERDASGP